MRRFVALSLVTAAAVAAGGAAHARSERGEVTRADVEQRTAQSFARMDANGDGRLDAADREARQKQRFDHADADGDGAISFAEFSARPGARAEGEVRAEGNERRSPRFGRGGRGMARAADADSDGTVTQAEFASAALARFDRADADGNGTISRDELRASRGAMRHRRQPREAG